MAFIALSHWLPVSPRFLYPTRVVVVVAVLLVCSRRLVSFRAGNWVGSILVGVAVFVLWIIPDLLSPSYRSHGIFDNSLVGSARSSVPADLRSDPIFIAFRVFGSVALVPILEELFWRGWLMRWFIRPDFEAVRLGTYTRYSFWVTAVLFAAEHGPYWDVGLLAGITYNWWMLQTHRLADCIVAHAVTNGLLAIYVLYAGRWQYWP
jgi:CAAX prenyl protease-related protein